ncbi:hypothetical protein, partial [Burkholderia cepacia]
QRSSATSVKGRQAKTPERQNWRESGGRGGAPLRLSSLIDERAAQIFSRAFKKSVRPHFAHKTVKNRPRRSSHQ